MATLAAMLADVYSLTNRPDLVAESTLAVKAATLKAHQSDYFPRDLKEQGIQFLAPSYYQSFDYQLLFPLWRSLSYFRKYDTLVSPQPDVKSKELKVITPAEVFDSYGLMISDVVYQAGIYLQIRSSTQLLYSIVGYYANPDTTYTVPSWISDQCPDAIILEAARRVFKTIGYDEQAATYEQLVKEQYMILRNSNILAIGY